MIHPILSKISNAFKRTPILLYAFEFENNEFKPYNMYLTSMDQTILFYTPYISNTMITRVIDENKIRLEEIDAAIYNLHPLSGNASYFDLGVNDTEYNIISNTTEPISFTPTVDIILNLRTFEYSKIERIEADKVTYTLHTPMPINKIYDPIVILRKRCFIPYGIAHEPYKEVEMSENLSCNIKLDNMVHGWTNTFIKTNHFDTCKVKIISTDIMSMELGWEGIPALKYDTFYVNNVYYDDLIMNFKLVDKFQILNQKIITRSYNKTMCPFEFGSDQCGIPYELFQKYRTCNGSWEQCTERKNTKNFGAFINIATDNSNK